MPKHRTAANATTPSFNQLVISILISHLPSDWICPYTSVLDVAIWWPPLEH
jgi:hypothetical protein